MIDLSIVIPVLNEELNVSSLYSETLKALQFRPALTFEIIWVDDGSTDGTLAKLAKIAAEDERIKVISFRRNFGQTAAMYAGFQYSVGEVVVPLDGDGQNDPADILRLVDRLSEGFECVSGWRVARKDNGLTRRLPSWVANLLIAKLTGLTIHDSGCTLKAYNGNFLRRIHLYGDMHRLIPFYIQLTGGAITEEPVNHRPRSHGTSKYGLNRAFRVFLDVVVAKVQADFARRPMHFFGKISAVIFAVSAALAFFAVYLKAAELADFVETPIPIIALICFLAGIQIFVSGLLAEIMLRKITLGTSDHQYEIRQIIDSHR